jgi:group II intron reverse transcriptase/maturase
VATDLTRVREYVEKHPNEVMTSLYHHVTDVDNLRACFKVLDGSKAIGIDGVTKEDYGKNLEENLENLSTRLKRMGYRPQNRKRAYIPKPGDEKGRPLAISVFEDKIVEMSVKRVLEQIYEPIFLECSYGYREKRSPHQCIDAIGKTVQQKRINHIVEADIRSFFDRLNWEWLDKFLRHRIGDDRLLRLIRRMLIAGIMEDGLVHANEEGAPQGSIVSPILSNVYLHYVLDLWFEKRVKPNAKGEAHLFRFADDFLCVFQFKDEAEAFERNLKDRLDGFGLQIAPEKTRRLEYGPYAVQNAKRRKEKVPRFTFLGFTHYCGKTRSGYFKVKRHTSVRKKRLKLREYTEWIKENRGVFSTGDLMRRAKSRLQGHLNYYAVTDNSKMCNEYHYLFTRITFKWLNRRSQRKSYTWEAFEQMLECVKWPKLKIKVDLCPFRA